MTNTAESLVSATLCVRPACKPAGSDAQWCPSVRAWQGLIPPAAHPLRSREGCGIRGCIGLSCSFRPLLANLSMLLTHCPCGRRLAEGGEGTRTILQKRGSRCGVACPQGKWRNSWSVRPANRPGPPGFACSIAQEAASHEWMEARGLGCLPRFAGAVHQEVHWTLRGAKGPCRLHGAVVSGTNHGLGVELRRKKNLPTGNGDDTGV